MGGGWEGYSFSAEVTRPQTRVHLEFMVRVAVNKKTNKNANALKNLRWNPQKKICKFMPSKFESDVMWEKKTTKTQWKNTNNNSSSIANWQIQKFYARSQKQKVLR